MSELANQLAALEAMAKSELAEHWVKLTRQPAPKLSPTMLRLALGYELQAKALSRLSRKALQQLSSVATKPDRNRLRPGTRLAREHGGKLHVVAISEDGAVIWNGRPWRSLSEVARAITGTRWSGPAFFGLRDRKKAT